MRGRRKSGKAGCGHREHQPIERIPAPFVVQITQENLILPQQPRYVGTLTTRDPARSLHVRNSHRRFRRCFGLGWGRSGSRAQKAIELYGADALTAAAHCGLTANFDGRERDFRFWVKVFRLLGQLAL